MWDNFFFFCEKLVNKWGKKIARTKKFFRNKIVFFFFFFFAYFFESLKNMHCVVVGELRE